MARLLQRNTPEKRQSGQLRGIRQSPAPTETADLMNRGEKTMMTLTLQEHRIGSPASESLLTLEMVAAAAKAVGAQGRDDHLWVTIVCCELASESVTFQANYPMLSR